MWSRGTVPPLCHALAAWEPWEPPLRWGLLGKEAVPHWNQSQNRVSVLDRTPPSFTLFPLGWDQ